MLKKVTCIFLVQNYNFQGKILCEQKFLWKDVHFMDGVYICSAYKSITLFQNLLPANFRTQVAQQMDGPKERSRICCKCCEEDSW